MDDKDEIARRLDEVVGTRYHEARTFGEHVRLGLVKWILGVVFAIAAAVLVVVLIESHRMPPAAQVPAPKPVTVTIVPAR
jgi:hypothetical protein